MGMSFAVNGEFSPLHHVVVGPGAGLILHDFWREIGDTFVTAGMRNQTRAEQIAGTADLLAGCRVDEVTFDVVPSTGGSFFCATLPLRRG
ncbi:hypothetical protein [Roseovarius amoyensis]|uniref:hypothetical protein n=1 Tax=Roseovarius amoyensis TaxID=2211448 RepID=UPI0013A6AEBD|nr:hypothetical protein [Roseovarius amoyensis]